MVRGTLAATAQPAKRPPGLTVLPGQPLPTLPSTWQERFGLGRAGPCPQGSAHCHGSRSAELVERLFSGFKPRSVARHQLEAFTAGTHGRYC